MPTADVRSRYERALEITPEHAGALRGYAQMLPPHDRAARLPVLDRLYTVRHGKPLVGRPQRGGAAGKSRSRVA